jgi:hypothetical protein
MFVHVFLVRKCSKFAPFFVVSKVRPFRKRSSTRNDSQNWNRYILFVDLVAIVYIPPGLPDVLFSNQKSQFG